MEAGISPGDAPASLSRRLVGQARRAGRIAKRLRRTAARRLNSTPAVPSEPTLKYAPVTDQWTVTHAGSSYVPETDVDVHRLLGLLPLEVVDDLSTAPLAAVSGTVKVEEGDSTATLEFFSHRSPRRERRPTSAGDVAVPAAQWTVPPASDGWLETETSLRIDAARRVRIEAYLPPSDGGGNKEITIVAHVGRRVEIDVAVLQRGERAWVDLYSSDGPAKALVIDIHSSYAERVRNEERQLGFVLTDISVTA